MLAEILKGIGQLVNAVVDFIVNIGEFINNKCLGAHHSVYICETDFSDEDEQDIYGIVDVLNSHFQSGDIDAELRELPVIERVHMIETIAEDIWTLLGLDKLSFEISYELDNLVRGYYNFERRCIVMNANYFTTDNKVLLLDLLDTLIHETRHALQADALDGNQRLNFSQSKLTEWYNCFKNPISSQRDYKGYYDQPSEVDARDYAARILHEFEEGAQ